MKKLLTVLLIVLLLCGCSSKDNGGLKPKDIAGDYKMIGNIYDGEEIVADQLAYWDQYGYSFDMTIDENGHALADFRSQRLELDFNASALTFEAGEQTGSFTYEDGILTMVFTEKDSWTWQRAEQYVSHYDPSGQQNDTEGSEYIVPGNTMTFGNDYIVFKDVKDVLLFTEEGYAPEELFYSNPEFWVYTISTKKKSADGKDLLDRYKTGEVLEENPKVRFFTYAGGDQEDEFYYSALLEDDVNVHNILLCCKEKDRDLYMDIMKDILVKAEGTNKK